MKNLTFYDYLNTKLCINEPALNLILSQYCRKVNYRKNDIIYLKGKVPSNLSYIETGNAIALSQSKPNRKVLRFWITNQFICPSGFFDHTPSPQSIVALDYCVISSINYRKLFSFLNDFPQAYKIINAILKAEISQVELNIKSISQEPSQQDHEALLEALALSFDE